MRIVLEIEDRLHREANAEAARQGITLDQFIQEAVEMRLDQRPVSDALAVSLPTYASSAGFGIMPEQLKRLANDSQIDHDLDKFA